MPGTSTPGSAGLGTKIPYAVAIAGVGVALGALSSSALTTKTDALYSGQHASGLKVFTAPTADNQSLAIGGQVFVARATGIDAGVQPDATVAVNCGGDACSSAPSAAATFGAALAAQPTNKVIFAGRDGGVAYFRAKDAGPNGNVAIGGTLAGASLGMRGGGEAIASAPQFEQAPDLGDASATIQPFTDKATDYAQRLGVRTANRTITLGVTSAYVGAMVAVRDFETSSRTLTVANGGLAGGNLATFPTSHTRPMIAWFYCDGTNWSFVGFAVLRPPVN
jgi:hypothetical protein